MAAMEGSSDMRRDKLCFIGEAVMPVAQVPNSLGFLLGLVRSAVEMTVLR